MEKITDIKPYLHLYLGCGFMRRESVKRGVDQNCSTQLMESDWLGGRHSDIVLVLRRLPSMTEEEKKEYARLFRGMTSVNILPEISAGRLINYHLNSQSPHSVAWLLSKSFDIFGLIDSNLAIEKTL
jgi:hypothetical protein